MNKEIMPAFSLSTIISMIILWAVIHILFAILDIDNDIHRISQQLEIDIIQSQEK